MHMATVTAAPDEWLFGWNPTPGIVSVWADREGRALVWQRQGERVTCRRQRFRPWLFAATLADLAHLGPAVQPEGTPRAAVTYCELEGPPGRLRYLISASSGRALERAICQGASQRLGHTVTSLYDLDDYYRVGPIEQFLMQTGQTYFQGLVYADLHRLQFDLETTALDPQRGRIFLIAVRDSWGFETVLEAPDPADEGRMIGELCRIITLRNPDVIENHNLFGFDLPFLEARAEANHVTLRLGRPEGPNRLERINEPGDDGSDEGRFRRYSVAGRELLDTLDATRRHDFVARDLPSHRLKDVARHFGIARPERVYIAGADVASTYRDNPELVKQYALDDVAEVDGLARRLLTPAFALAQMAPRRFERVAYAGPAMGILEPMLLRAYLRAGAAPPHPSSNASPADPHTGGALFLFATGIAQHVVKADIASLYPSLMRVYGIGPQCDQLGVLLGIVDRLTGLRLEHKAAARSATPGTLEAGHYNAMQAAMKLIINAAYGYMGAGHIALFADRAAADEVTRRGREVLGHVVQELRSRGTALIEADTDGVFFAVPQEWDEGQERALVAEVAATLPDGIRLEYEGRYAAMFSHEVKNYALLTYGGQLIVRGVAMRSSRSEPFGERFLKQALHCALVGDVAGVRRALLDTATALRQRDLSAADVATRVRLSKKPEAYMRSRAGHREAGYEALLAAGRTTWRAGEKVRCYKTTDGGYVWLPDETAEDKNREPENQEPSTSGDVGVVGVVGDVEVVGDARTTRQPDNPTTRQPHLRRDYDVGHYLELLVNSYASRLRKAFHPDDFAQLTRLDGQLGLFDQPVEGIEPIWIRPSGQP
jgi:DNA polymerase elongation subunit (family B)